MNLSSRLSTGLWLAGLVFLGFYVFGLIMGVYSPGEVLYFTVPAAVLTVAAVAYLIWGRRSTAARADEDETIRDSRRLREGRGF